MKDHEELSLMPVDSADYKNVEPGTSLVVEWLRLHIANVGSVSSRSKLVGRQQNDKSGFVVSFIPSLIRQILGDMRGF